MATEKSILIRSSYDGITIREFPSKQEAQMEMRREYTALLPDNMDPDNTSSITDNQAQLYVGREALHWMIMEFQTSLLGSKELVYICSPYRGDHANNIKLALKYARKAWNEGYVPIVPHVYFTQFLDDNIECEREAGLEMGRILIKYCSAMWVIGPGISSGMQGDIERAREYGLPIKVINGNMDIANTLDILMENFC